jgi:hypothetical protein
VHSAGWTVFIEASNMSKTAKAAAENGHMVVDLTSSGWIPNLAKLKNCARLLKN